MRSRSQILQIGALLAAVAVVVSVVFVGIEIRQNSEVQIRAATQAAVSDYIGSLDEETWSGLEGLLTETTRYPGVRQWVAVRRQRFSPGFLSTIDALMRDNAPIDDCLFADAADPACA